MSEIIQLPEGNTNSGNATIPFSIPIGFGGFNNGGMFGNGNGFNSIADLFGLGILGSMFSGSGFCSSSPSMEYLKKTIEEDAKAEEIAEKAE